MYHSMATPRHAPLSLFGIRLDNPAHDCVVDPHSVLLAVANQRLRNFAVSPDPRIGGRVMVPIQGVPPEVAWPSLLA